jgi:hypothetical protein
MSRCSGRESGRVVRVTSWAMAWSLVSQVDFSIEADERGLASEQAGYRGG